MREPQLDRYTFKGSPWVGDNVKDWLAQSSITYASQIKTPTLILYDIGDARAPITQAYELYHALKDNGVPVKFVAYPVATHSPDDPVRHHDLYPMAGLARPVSEVVDSSRMVGDPEVGRKRGLWELRGHRL